MHVSFAMSASGPLFPQLPTSERTSGCAAVGRVEDGRGSLGPMANAPFPIPAHRTGRADFRHPACMGLSSSRGITPFLSSFVIPFFCSTRAASILPSRPHISIAVARSGGQGRRFFSAAEGLSLTDASTAAGCRRSGGWPRDDPRGACHWPRSIARTTLVFG